ncbi:hypothetical protein PAMA_014009 [Pampus argenteus]
MGPSTSHQSNFTCSICLDDFTDPVTTPCGHNFCKVCIDTYWDSTDIIQCPLCQRDFTKKPQLCVNVMLRELIEQKQTNIQNDPENETEPQDVFCDVCPEEKTVMAVKSCLHCEVSFCAEHLKPHLDDAELKTHELLDPVGKLKERICKQHKAPLELVCHEDLICVCLLCIKSNHRDHKCVPLKTRLRKKKAKVDKELAEVEQQISYRKNMAEKVDQSRELSESLNSLCEPPHTKDWSEVSAYSDSAVGTVRCGVGKMLMMVHSKVNDEMKAFITKVDVTLDPNTANHLLVVSKNGKEVRNGGIPQKLPDNPERFDTLLGVLGKEGYSSGAFYFEVQVEGKAGWDIGVAVETVERKQRSDVSLNQGFAVLMLRDEKTLKACDRPQVELNMSQKIKKVGVFVDHEEGEVFFYDVDNKAHIYSFTCCKFPRKRLHPYFNPCSLREGNSAPMIITPIS